MFGSNILDTAIGLVFIYSILSVITSSLNEMIASWTGKRSTNLAEGITELLNGDPEVTLQKLYDHPLVSSLFKGKYATASKATELPSYIPSRNFALAMMDIVRKSGAGGSGADFVTSLNAMPDGPVKQSLQAIVANAGSDVQKIRQSIEHWYGKTWRCHRRAFSEANNLHPRSSFRSHFPAILDIIPAIPTLCPRFLSRLLPHPPDSKTAKSS
jgi:hypothetical protein